MSPEESGDRNNSVTHDSTGESSAEQETEVNDDDELVFLFANGLGPIHLDEGDVLRKQLNHLVRTENWNDAVKIFAGKTGYEIVSIHVKEPVKVSLLLPQTSR